MMKMGYISLLYTKILERKLKKKTIADAKNRENNIEYLRKEIKFTEKNKRIGNVFLETLIENGASEGKCIPYANRLAELEQELFVSRQNLENFGNDNYVTIEYTLQPFSPEFTKQFTERGKEVYFRTKESVASKYKKEGVAAAATV